MFLRNDNKSDPRIQNNSMLWLWPKEVCYIGSMIRVQRSISTSLNEEQCLEGLIEEEGDPGSIPALLKGFSLLA